MSNQPEQTVQSFPVAAEWRQSILEQPGRSQEAVEELSEEELEAVAGGALFGPGVKSVFKWGMRALDVGTIAVAATVGVKKSTPAATPH